MNPDTTVKIDATDTLQVLPTPNLFSIGDVLLTSRKTFSGPCSKSHWVCESVSKSFTTLTELEWSKDLTNEMGCCRRKGCSLRRKIKRGLPYCAKLGVFNLCYNVKVLPNVQS